MTAVGHTIATRISALPIFENGPCVYNSKWQKSVVLATSRDDRIAIQTALQFRIPHPQIYPVLAVTNRRHIYYARTHPRTLKKSKYGTKVLIQPLSVQL